MKSNNKNDNNNKKWKNFGLYALLGIVVITLGTTLLDSQPAAQGEWRYSKLLEEVRNQQVFRESPLAPIELLQKQPSQAELKVRKKFV